MSFLESKSSYEAKLKLYLRSASNATLKFKQLMLNIDAFASFVAHLPYDNSIFNTIDFLILSDYILQHFRIEESEW